MIASQQFSRNLVELSGIRKLWGLILAVRFVLNFQLPQAAKLTVGSENVRKMMKMVRTSSIIMHSMVGVAFARYLGRSWTFFCHAFE